MMEFCKHNYRTARKAHTCALCESIIRPFSRYVETIYKSDGKITRDRYHSMCHVIMKRYCEEHAESDKCTNSEIDRWFKGVYCSHCVNTGECKFTMNECLQIWA